MGHPYIYPQYCVNCNNRMNPEADNIKANDGSEVCSNECRSAHDRGGDGLNDNYGRQKARANRELRRKKKALEAAQLSLETWRQWCASPQGQAAKRREEETYGEVHTWSNALMERAKALGRRDRLLQEIRGF